MLQVENEINVIPEPRAKVSRTVFKFMNTYYMVPLSKLGLLPWMQNPLTGYIMFLQTIGRKIFLISTSRPLHAQNTSLIPVNLSIDVSREEKVSFVASQEQ